MESGEELADWPQPNPAKLRHPRWRNLAAAGELSERPGRATRSFTRFTADTSYTVKIVVSPKTGVEAYAVEEHLPAGWTASDVSDAGQYDAAAETIRWGIFLDDQSR